MAMSWSRRATRPERPEDAKGIKGMIYRQVQKRAGAGAPSANRITLLRDADGDGVAEMRTLFLKDLDSPFGMALVGDTLYVANADAVVSFPYTDGRHADHRSRRRRSPTCPAGPLNHHWTKSLIANRDGTQALRRRSAPTATSPRTAWRRKTGAPRSTRSISRRGAVARVRLRAAQSGRHGLRAGERRAMDGR